MVMTAMMSTMDEGHSKVEEMRGRLESMSKVQKVEWIIEYGGDCEESDYS
jgi:hypothetical protein